MLHPGMIHAFLSLHHLCVDRYAVSLGVTIGAVLLLNQWM
jgi:hypothetical protein